MSNDDNTNFEHAIRTFNRIVPQINKKTNHSPLLTPIITQSNDIEALYGTVKEIAAKLEKVVETSKKRSSPNSHYGYANFLAHIKSLLKKYDIEHQTSSDLEKQASGALLSTIQLLAKPSQYFNSHTYEQIEKDRERIFASGNPEIIKLFNAALDEHIPENSKLEKLKISQAFEPLKSLRTGI